MTRIFIGMYAVFGIYVVVVLLKRNEGLEWMHFSGEYSTGTL